MRKFKLPVTVLCLALLLGLTGCKTVYQPPEAVEIHRMSDMDMDVQHNNLDGPLSPVMQDVYDRSISTEVYSVE
ncbi:hypothetical protein [Paenibacillus tianjinensis]|uniref:YlzJ-like protein n=1 Tax=Paenibacillus tianjinensis TaxID=2810347 RepID=A0ABX7LFV4_9BACL|nr:hypothetical protein [Paenibacillus tianjinensis]QSF46988.1 hypothetical protein JRJ22_10710 [Paenibacillus tianjinensis]